jgi:WD40 repeat protein
VTASINKEIAFWDLAEVHWEFPLILFCCITFVHFFFCRALIQIAHNTQVSPIKVLKNHSDWVRVVRMKDGVMLSGGSDSQIIYWSTPLEEEEDDVFLGDFNVLFSED